MFLGHGKDSLWSVDLFRCESLTIKTYWFMGMTDPFTGRIIGFAVQAGVTPRAKASETTTSVAELRNDRW